MTTLTEWLYRAAVLSLVAASVEGQLPHAENVPQISITTVPPADSGGPDRMDRIAGSATACDGCKAVLFAKGDVWYVQPWTAAPLTDVDSSGNWSAAIHLGSEYAALLVRRDYKPPERTPALPGVGGDILARTVIAGRQNVEAPRANATTAPRRGIRFAGYDWTIKTSDRPIGPGPNYFNEDNAWVDPDGKLHLKIAKVAEHWTCAELINQQALGYGTYTWVIADVSHLPPNAVLGLFTWDDQAEQFSHREIDVEVSRWGDPNNQNGQFVVQPYTKPENIVRFNIPSGPTKHSFIWTPERVVSRSAVVSGSLLPQTAVIVEHTFTTGIPPTGGEHVRINFWLAGNVPVKGDILDEIVVEDFQFAPMSASR